MPLTGRKKTRKRFQFTVYRRLDILQKKRDGGRSDASYRVLFSLKAAK